MKIECPNCGKLQNIPEVYINKTVKCLKCKAEILAIPFKSQKEETKKETNTAPHSNLAKCRHCGGQVSHEAKTCPHCGLKYPSKAKHRTHMILSVIALIFVIWMLESTFRSCSEVTEPISDSPEVLGQNEVVELSPKEETTVKLIEDIAKLIRTENVEQSSNEEGEKIYEYKMNEIFTVGYMAYSVESAEWKDKLADGFGGYDYPDAAFLLVKTWVMNQDKKARTIPPFHLVDETGAEYNTSSKGPIDTLDFLVSLNPGVSRIGLIIFDAPIDHNYLLKLSGGYWSLEDVFVKIPRN